MAIDTLETADETYEAGHKLYSLAGAVLLLVLGTGLIVAGFVIGPLVSI